MSATTEVDVFISYARRDNFDLRVSALTALLVETYRNLTNGEELTVFFDTTDIAGMDDWQHRILNGLRSARLLVTFLSPSYFKSQICRWEFDEYLKHEAARTFLGEGIAPIYFIEVPGLGSPANDQIDEKWATELRRRQYFDFRPWADRITDAATNSNFIALIQELAYRIHERFSRARRFAKCPGNVDRQNEYFVDRFEELRRLRELGRLNKLGVLTAVHGLGGIGKTALATEYAYVFAHEYPAGRWKVECEGHDDLRVALSALAGTRDLDFSFTDAEKVDLDLSFERVLRELKTRSEQVNFGRVLLLLDNVDQAVLLEPAQTQRLPKADWLDIIVTTRLGANELYGTQNDRAFLPVDELPENYAVSLIEKCQPFGKFADETERKAARDIVSLLGGFTLAIETAAVFLSQFAQDVTCSGFRDRLISEGLNELEKASEETSERLRHREKSLTATMRATLERLAEPEKLAMRIASLLPPDHVVLPWLRALVARKFPAFGTDAKAGHPDPWQSLLRRLFSLRLLQRTVENDVARMHRLLRLVFRPSAEAEVTRNIEAALLSYIQARADFLWDGWAKRENRWEIDSLVACAWQWIEQGFAEGAYLANQISKPLKNLCRFAEAERLLRKALAMVETMSGSNHPNVATALNNLAQLLHSTGQLGEVESLFWGGVQIDEQYYGANHQTVGRDLHNLALYLQDTNRLLEAEKLALRALKINEDRLGANHANVAICLNSLGKILAARDDPEGAERNYRRALELFEQLPAEELYGKYNADFCALLDGLAAFLQIENRLEESEKLLRRALNVRKKVFSLDHPTVAQSLFNLGELYYYRGQYKKSECLSRRALANFEKVFGPIHPNISSCLSNLAAVLKQTNRREEAEEKLRKALEIDEANYGPTHPSIAIRLNILAALLQDVRRFVDAEPLYRRAILIVEESYGLEDQRVAGILNNLANMLQKADRPEEAVTVLTRALNINEKRFGSNHPKVGTNLNNLAEIYISQQLCSDALPLIQRARSIQEEAFGPEHPDLAACLDSLGRVHQAQANYTEAKKVQEQAVSIRERFLGPEHPETALSLTNLGVTYQRLRQYARAEECFQRSISVYEKEYSREHVDLASILNCLAGLYYELAQYSEAEPLYVRSLTIWTNILGPSHPKVALGLNNMAQLYRAEGRYDEAEPAFRKALEILLTVYADSHQSVRHVIRNYVSYLRDRGRNLQDILILIGEIAQPFGINLTDLVLTLGSE
jgi:tetratricopeptide (TPR) repeat protein